MGRAGLRQERGVRNCSAEHGKFQVYPVRRGGLSSAVRSPVMWRTVLRSNAVRGTGSSKVWICCVRSGDAICGEGLRGWPMSSTVWLREARKGTGSTKVWKTLPGPVWLCIVWKCLVLTGLASFSTGSPPAFGIVGRATEGLRWVRPGPELFGVGSSKTTSGERKNLRNSGRWHYI